jgi:hypothetical protein
MFVINAYEYIREAYLDSDFEAWREIRNESDDFRQNLPEV